jgi:hypothetical protein
VIVAHVLGLPVEESVVQLLPAGAAMATILAIAARAMVDRLRRPRTRRHPPPRA